MKKILPYLFLINCFFSFSQTPSFEWANTNGGVSDQINSSRVLTDASNNIFVAGNFNGTVDFNPGIATNNVTSAGQQDGYIVKFDPLGNFLWVKTFGGVDSDGVEDMHFDSQGNIILVGHFSLMVDFDPGAGITSITSNGVSSDIFILKLTASGLFTYVKTIGGASMDISYSLEIDDLNNIYITGQCMATADFDPGVGVVNLFGSGIYVLKLNSNGTFIWAKRFTDQMINGVGVGYYDKGFSICVDNNFNVHIVGEFTGSCDFDPEVGTYIIASLPNSGTPDINIFYAKLDVNGSFISAHQLNGVNPYMEIDDFDNLYLTGNFYTSIDFDPGVGNTTLNGPGTQFIRKTDSNSNLAWVINTGAIASCNFTKPLTINNLNEIYFSSYYTNTIDIDPSAIVYNIASLGVSGNKNVFISKFNNQGSFIFGISYGSASSNNELNSFTIDNNSAIISTGHYAPSQFCDFDPSASLFELTGGNNFLQKLSQCAATSSTITPSVCVSYSAPDGVIHTNTGQYFATIPNASGCDSIITINLTINTNTTNSISPIVCESYTAPDNQIYTQSGQYFATLPNSTGCDSIISINLIVNTVSTSTISPIACKSYTAPDNQVYTQSGQYFATIPNASGCDSLITINLTVNNVNTSIILNEITLTAVASGLQYEWIDCNNNNSIISGENNQSFVASSNGNYAVIVTDGNCVDTSDCIQIDKVSIDELCDLTILISPNPAISLINIKSSIALVGSKYIIYDQLGKESIIGIITSENTEIDLSKLIEGVYIIKIGSDTQHSFKLIKE